MVSLRTRLTLALLGTSLAAVALVGGVAQWRLSQKFSDVVLRDSFRNYQQDVVAYIQTYGSWEQAEAQERFGGFVHRRHRAMGGPPPGSEPIIGMPRPPAAGQGQPPGPDGGPPPDAQGGPPQDPQGGPPPDGQGGQPQDAQGAPPPAPQGGQPPGGPQREQERPPFRFLLLDPAGRVLMENPPYLRGQTVPDSVRKTGLPVEVNGKRVALAVPLDKPNLSDLDLGYLSAMREALLYGIAAAAGLAVLLGLLLGTGLSRALRKLTGAIQEMEAGNLLQRVDIRSSGEIGVLAGAFNRMSEELARSHEELRRSNETIREQASQLRELAIRDGLTQLYNRRHFDEQAARLFSHAERYDHPLTVMIGDIDHFKLINDRFSHAVGDEVLRQVGRLLQSHSRGSDLVARYGGEEFVMALAQTDLEQAAVFCEKLRERIESHPWQEIHPELKVTMSIGLCADRIAAGVEKMLVLADTRLYQAKAGGRNQVCYA